MMHNDKEKEQEEGTMKNPMHQEPLLQVQAPPLEWIAVNDAILARLASLSGSSSSQPFDGSSATPVPTTPAGTHLLVHNPGSATYTTQH
jgi:hypothetical protein